MLRRTAFALACVGVSVTAFAIQPEPAGPPVPVPLAAAGPAVPVERPLVQVALLLDTSNSMDGLIDQARTQLWRIVNEIGKCRRDGQMPRVQVSLFEYGNTHIPAGENYVRMVLPLTDNLDDVSEKLFALKTNGGDEYCAAVIQSATKGLQWVPDPKVYKSIFVCGNEPFTQGPIDFKAAIPPAVAKGIVVNTIHCGSRDDGVSGMWAAGADLGQGKFLNINQDQRITVIATPYDERIKKISIELNVTYIPYGKAGVSSAERQSTQDKLAEQNAGAGSSVERALTKSSSVYSNGGWDLVDAIDREKKQLSDFKDEELPEPMRGKSLEEKQKYIESQRARRTELQAEAQKLNAEREKYIAENAKKDPKDTLDSAMVEVVRVQMKEKKYETP
jgi:hypothetical protein